MCQVILYGSVWDVTAFFPNHPGGSNIILKLAGKNATEEYDPIHPPGTRRRTYPRKLDWDQLIPKLSQNR
jgi:cytochrome b involved in lipid metabolism